MKYTITFDGKEKNAIGCMCSYIETVEAEDRDKAILKLYEKYDHISFPQIRVIQD